VGRVDVAVHWVVDSVFGLMHHYDGVNWYQSGNYRVRVHAESAGYFRLHMQTWRRPGHEYTQPSAFNSALLYFVTV
jgi:hypothetical protein